MPVRFMAPSTTSMIPTESSMERPTRVGMTQPSRMMPLPTMRIVRVWPTPQMAPMRAALRAAFARVTIVETAMT